jgi:pimeloyl-ACP methyl ester carboxylesterase
MILVVEIILTLLFVWLLMSRFIMQYRITDEKAKRLFAKDGVSLFTETITVNNYKLHYAKTGGDDKPTLYFIHGSPGSWFKFKNYLKDKDLLEKYRMISVDRPGFGFSEFGNAKNLKKQSTLISSLMKRLQNDKPSFAIGPSLGGPLVVRLAMDNPGKFSGLILLAAAIDPKAEKPEKWRGFFSLPLLEYLIPGAWRPSNKEIWYLKKDLIGLAAGFATITCPVYVLHGDKDQWVDVSNAAYAKEMLINASFVFVRILPGANHSVVYNYYELIKEILLNLS